MKVITRARLRTFSEFTSILIAIIGIVILLGWAFDISIFKSPNSIFSTAKSNAALCFVLIGTSLWLLQSKRINKRNRMIAQVLALIVVLIGILTLGEYLFNINIGIDQILFTELPGTLKTSSPNRMAFTAALNFLLAGIALLIIDKETKKGYMPAFMFIILEGVISLIALTGYLYNSSSLYQIYNYTAIAIYAIITFILIFFSFISLRPDKGFMKVLTADRLGSKLGLAAAPILLIIPLFLGGLLLLGYFNGFYDTSFLIALFTVSLIIIIAISSWIGVISLNNNDKKRQNAENQIKEQNRILNGINEIFKGAIKYPTEEEFGKTCLRIVEEITGSHVSFMGEINPHGRFDSIAVSDGGWKACKMVEEDGAEAVNDNIIRGIRSRAIEKKRIVIYNNPVSSHYWSGLPKGHLEITSFMGVPLIYNDEVIGLVALANKEGGYNFKDEKNMELVSAAITESLMHYRAKNQLKISIKELERSNYELQQFAYITSHDLQEPLRTIASFTQLLERRYKGRLDDDADEFMDFIVSASIRMKKMIQDLLEYSRVGAGGHEFKHINTSEAVNRALHNLKILIEDNNAQIGFDSLPVIMGDDAQIVLLFQNLIGNAIKFKKPDEPPRIHISAKRDDEMKEYIFSVHDNGIGIEEQYTDRIFEVFKRLHTIDEYEGTGIGLSIVKKIIDSHHGRIWVDSEFGKGSTFHFTIPINDENRV